MGLERGILIFFLKKPKALIAFTIKSHFFPFWSLFFIILLSSRVNATCLIFVFNMFALTFEFILTNLFAIEVSFVFLHFNPYFVQPTNWLDLTF